MHAGMESTHNWALGNTHQAVRVGSEEAARPEDWYLQVGPYNLCYNEVVVHFEGDLQGDLQQSFRSEGLQ